MVRRDALVLIIYLCTPSLWALRKNKEKTTVHSACSKSSDFRGDFRGVVHLYTKLSLTHEDFVFSKLQLLHSDHVFAINRCL